MWDKGFWTSIDACVCSLNWFEIGHDDDDAVLTSQFKLDVIKVWDVVSIGGTSKDVYRL